MALFQKFNCVPLDLASGVHQLQTGTTHVFKAFLSNVTPVATMAVKAEVTEIAAGNGYTAGGFTITVTSGALTGGTFKLVLADPPTLTATGAIPTFQHVYLYNDTAAGKPLMGAWSYPTGITLADTQQFVIDFDPSAGVLTIA